MKSALITKFKNKLLRERRTFTKIFVSDEIPSGLEASREGIVHFTTRVGGQLHQMYSLAEMSAVLPSVPTEPPVGSTEPPVSAPDPKDNSDPKDNTPKPNNPIEDKPTEGPIEPRPREDGPPGSDDGFQGNPDDIPHGDDPRRFAPQDDAPIEDNTIQE